MIQRNSSATGGATVGEIFGARVYVGGSPLLSPLTYAPVVYGGTVGSSLSPGMSRMTFP